jgi:Leucine-rich repeat (LRR) protein
MANWVWSQTAKSPNVPPAGEKITFQETLLLTSLPQHASVVITCDNEYRLWINRRLVAQDTNWESVESIDITSALQVGQNQILIEASNGGSGPNPAALFFQMKLVQDNSTKWITSSETMQYTNMTPDDQGKLPEEVTDWKNAVVAEGPWQGRLQNEIESLLSSDGSDKLMVRASLVKADPLMRSLGRPNRDQIVSMRPTELTTLEAMDLSNGQILADSISHGALQWISRLGTSHNKLESPEALIDQLFLHTLCRSPSAKELETIQDMIGPTLEQTELEDLLWSVVMLPEFQYVR